MNPDLLAIWCTVMTIYLPSVTICNHSSKLGCHYFSTPAFCICYYQKFAPSPLISAAFMHGGITSYPPYYTQFMVYSNLFAGVVAPIQETLMHQHLWKNSMLSLACLTTQVNVSVLCYGQLCSFLLMEGLTC